MGRHIMFKTTRVCSIEGCGSPMSAKGLCNKHSLRLKYNGDPLVTKIATRGQGDDWVRQHVGWADSVSCLLWPFGKHSRKNEQSYGAIGSRKAHVVMCTAAHGPKPSPLHQVAHACGNRLCVNPLHLRWATRAENMQDAVRHRTIGGERQHTAKLSPSAVREIRVAERGFGRTKALAAKYGVADGTIRAVWRGDYWRRVV
jgi:hypothetical protein